MMDLGDAGSWASIVSLPISLWTLGVSIHVAARLKEVRRRIVFNVRADDLLQELEKARSGMAERLLAFPDGERQIETIMRQCIAQIHVLRHITSPDADLIALSLSKLERRYGKVKGMGDTDKKLRIQLDLLWQIHDGISIFLMHMQNVVADRRVGGSDDL